MALLSTMLEPKKNRSEQPASSLPGVTTPEVDSYDAETEVDSDVPVETPDVPAIKSSESP